MGTIKTGAENRVPEDILAFGALTSEDVARYLSAKNAKSNCVQCDQNDWEITNPQSEGASYMALRRGGYGMSPNTYVPMLMMICRNCSNLRLLAALPIVEWSLKEGKNG